MVQVSEDLPGQCRTDTGARMTVQAAASALPINCLVCTYCHRVQCMPTKALPCLKSVDMQACLPECVTNSAVEARPERLPPSNQQQGPVLDPGPGFIQ
jgi:hypothetical protein